MLWAGLSLMTAMPCQAAGLRLVTDFEYSRFTDPGLPDGGVAAELVLAAFETAGVAVEPIEFLPWKRGYEAVLDRKYDAIFPDGQTPGQDQAMLFSAPIYEVELWPVFRSDRARPFTGLESLAGSILCEPIGRSPPAELQPLIGADEISLVEAASLQLCARQLLADRINLLIVSAPLFNKIVRPEWHEGLPPVRGDHPVTIDRQFLLMARSNAAAPDLLNRFASGLAALRRDGRYDIIVNRHRGDLTCSGRPTCTDRG